MVGKNEKSPLDKSYGVPQYLPFYNYVAGSLGIISAFYSTPKIFLLTLILHFFLMLSIDFFKNFFGKKTKILCIFNGKKILNDKKIVGYCNAVPTSDIKISGVKQDDNNNIHKRSVVVNKMGVANIVEF